MSVEFRHIILLQFTTQQMLWLSNKSFIDLSTRISIDPSPKHHEHEHHEHKNHEHEHHEHEHHEHEHHDHEHHEHDIMNMNIINMNVMNMKIVEQQEPVGHKRHEHERHGNEHHEHEQLRRETSWRFPCKIIRFLHAFSSISCYKQNDGMPEYRHRYFIVSFSRLVWHRHSGIVVSPVPLVTD